MTSDIRPQRRGALLEMCIALYRLHRMDATGWCVVCRIPGVCPPRRNCIKIMRAAQLDPNRFDVPTAGKAGRATGQSVNERPSAYESSLRHTATELVKFHISDRDGLCIGCAKQWNQLIIYPCSQASWAHRVLQVPTDRLQHPSGQ